MAALALRAAGAESPFARPASFFCHYLSVAAFEPVELRGHAVAGGPHGAGAAGRDDPGRPAGARRHGLVGRRGGGPRARGRRPARRARSGRAARHRATLWPDEDRPAIPFWDNFDQRLDRMVGQLAARRARCRRRGAPGCAARPTATFDDPWVDAARSLIVLDVGSWPAGSRPHAYLDPPFIAPSLDLYASFQYPGQRRRSGCSSMRTRRWPRAACCRGPAGSGREDRRLIASGGGQAVFRHT